MSRKKQDTQPVGAVIDQLLSQLGIAHRISEQRVLAEFEKIMGEPFCKRASAVKIERGVLFLEAANAAWRQELFYQKQMIRQRLNEGLGEDIVREIIFR
jgi:predicted nucleic acid-binding Zn ribbon protein